MTDIHGGRVLAGEDSEEDEEEDEAYSFQFGGFGARGGVSGSAPRFTAPTVVATPQAGGEESDEEDEEDEEKGAAGERAAPTLSSEGEESEKGEDGVVDASTIGAGDAVKEAAASGSASSSSFAGTDSSLSSKNLAVTAPPSSLSPTNAPKESITPREEIDDELWSADSSMDGPRMMGESLLRSMQPALDASIQRIEELQSNQTRLLQLLAEQNASVASSKQIEDAGAVLDKLPHYFAKIQMIRAAMTEISASTDKMKRRAESLRIDAQSHALKKENKRDAQSQWNKLYAAKSAAPASATGES